MLSKKMGEMWDVVVVGSCMVDLICYAPRLPKGGETVKGSDFSIGFGGKGCNQCVAAKKLGAETALVARVGDDSFGRDYVGHLRGLGIPTDKVRMTTGVTSGMAQITVSDSGENQIVIVAGANELLTDDDLRDAQDAIVNCKVLLCQMEINREMTLKALRMKSRGAVGKSILNVAPAVADMEPEFYTLPDILCVNETEAEMLSGLKIGGVNEAKEALHRLCRKGCRSVVITLGEDGAVFANDAEGVQHVPTDKVVSVDTTGAGDAFIGALGYFMARHPDMDMFDMIRKSCSSAALSVQKKGTQQSFPTWSELEEFERATSLRDHPS